MPSRSRHAIFLHPPSFQILPAKIPRWISTRPGARVTELRFAASGRATGGSAACHAPRFDILRCWWGSAASRAPVRERPGPRSDSSPLRSAAKNQKQCSVHGFWKILDLSDVFLFLPKKWKKNQRNKHPPTHGTLAFTKAPAFTPRGVRLRGRRPQPRRAPPEASASFATPAVMIARGGLASRFMKQQKKEAREKKLGYEVSVPLRA